MDSIYENPNSEHGIHEGAKRLKEGGSRVAEAPQFVKFSGEALQISECGRRVPLPIKSFLHIVPLFLLLNKYFHSCESGHLNGFCLRKMM